jgi:hypothetical protein
MAHSLLIALRAVKWEASGLARLFPPPESVDSLVPQAPHRALGPQGGNPFHPFNTTGRALP